MLIITFLKHPSSSKAYFLSNSLSLSKACFVFSSYFYIDESPFWSIPSLPQHGSYSTLSRNWWKSSIKHPSSSKACFLFDSLSKLMKFLSKASSLIHSMLLVQSFLKTDEILCEASLLFQTMFLILLFFKYGWNSLWNIPPLPKYVSYSSLNRN